MAILILQIHFWILTASYEARYFLKSHPTESVRIILRVYNVVVERARTHRTRSAPPGKRRATEPLVQRVTANALFPIDFTLGNTTGGLYVHRR